MYTRDVRNLSMHEGLNTMEADFVTEYMVIRGEVSTPEGRLSDHLNSSTTSLEVRPLAVLQAFTERSIDLAGAVAHITKAHLLYIVPISEPEKPSNTTVEMWTRTRSLDCWASFAGYTLEGKIHVEAGRDLRLTLRGLEQKQFLPMTSVRIATPSGIISEHEATIINRAHVEILSLRDV